MVIEIVVNFLRVTYGQGYNKLEKIRDIASSYFKSRFGIDLLCFLGLIIDLAIESEATIAARITFFLKVVDLMDKVEALETKLLNTSYKEHCWGLAKIFLTNFMLAHFLAVLLIMVTWLNEKENWLSKVNAMRAPWYEQYSWAYYWGTTIMFTVGFGDISAVNYQEAWLVVLIQTFSCITLAYNLNCVGALISNLRAEEIEKVKKQKILKHLSEKNSISQDLTVRINNYIEECSNIKKNFNIEEDSAFISSLPSSIKTSFLRESNKKIFEDLPFFNTFTDWTMLQLAEKIEMTITHPEQIIEKKNDIPGITILKQGNAAFCSKMRGSNHNNSVIDMIEVKDGEKPILLSLNFLNNLNKTKNYELVSKEYSVLYTMDIETLREILKGKDRDFEYFFFLKDKSKHILDEFEFKDCEFCSSKHLSFNCPKLHYVPINQEIIYKRIHKEKIHKNNRRRNFQR